MAYLIPAGIAMQLTAHFSLEEFTASSTATRLGIDNTPSQNVIDNLGKTAQLGEILRFALNSKAHQRGQLREVTMETDSGYRCEELEKVLCANDFAAWCKRHDMDPATAWPVYFARKQHPQGNALDFVAPRFGTPKEIVEYIASQPELMILIDQIIMEGDWVHVSRSDTPRHMALIATFDANGVPTYTQGVA